MAKITKTVAVLTLTACSLGLTSVASAAKGGKDDDRDDRKDDLKCEVKHFNKIVFFDDRKNLKEIIVEVQPGKFYDVEDLIKGKTHVSGKKIEIFDVEYSAVCVFDDKKGKGPRK